MIILQTYILLIIFIHNLGSTLLTRRIITISTLSTPHPIFTLYKKPHPITTFYKMGHLNEVVHTLHNVHSITNSFKYIYLLQKTHLNEVMHALHNIHEFVDSFMHCLMFMTWQTPSGIFISYKRIISIKLCMHCYIIDSFVYVSFTKYDISRKPYTMTSVSTL